MRDSDTCRNRCHRGNTHQRARRVRPYRQDMEGQEHRSDRDAHGTSRLYHRPYERRAGGPGRGDSVPRAEIVYRRRHGGAEHTRVEVDTAAAAHHPAVAWSTHGAAGRIYAACIHGRASRPCRSRSGGRHHSGIVGGCAPAGHEPVARRILEPYRHAAVGPRGPHRPA